MTFYALQFLRFVAATLVLLFHLAIVPSGYKGVDIFFVISGFVMYYTLFAKKRPEAVRFVINRSTKIYFLYWVSLVYLFFVAPVRFENLSIKSILLIPGHKSLIGVSWSLSFEIYFYCIIGSIAYIIPDKYHKAIFIALLGITSVTTVINHFTDRLLNTPYNYGLGPNFWEFLLGVLCGYLAIHYHRYISSRKALYIAISALLIFLVTDLAYMKPYTYAIYGLLSAVTILLFTIYEQERKITGKLAEFFSITGDASYGVYLFGPIVTLMVEPVTMRGNILVILLTFLISIGFNRLVEDRFLRFARKQLYRFLPSRSAATPLR
jgi:peptidoglycan/LPS O-acetylase OafA/YrhL